MDESPADPIGGLMTGAVGVHELFSAYVDAGFTRPEALVIVCHLLRPFQAPTA